MPRPIPGTFFWDAKYSGRLAALDDIADAVGAAALHVGVNAYDMSDDDIARVRAALVEQRPLLRFYSNDPTTMQQALASGEIVAANTWNDSYVSMKAQGPAGSLHAAETGHHGMGRRPFHRQGHATSRSRA